MSHLRRLISDLRTCWRDLLATALVFKVLAYVALTPIFGLLVRLFIPFSGSSVLSDTDILAFVMQPVGFVCAVLFVVLWLAIISIEQVALLSILCARTYGRHLGAMGALRFALIKSIPAVQITARMVVIGMTGVMPLGLIAFLVYRSMLTKYDINYYLQAKPPEFIASVVVGGCLLICAIALIARMATTWYFAFPIACFENVPGRLALRVSRERTKGKRVFILGWLIGWIAIFAGLSIQVVAVTGWIGRGLLWESMSSVRGLSIAVGIVVLVWSALSVVVNLIMTITFSSLLFRLYWNLGRKGDFEFPRGNALGTHGSLRIIRLNAKRVIGLGIAGVGLATAIGMVMLHRSSEQSAVQVMAHRGSSKAAPENTLASIRQAIQDGADWVEIDVQETADGEVVVVHDSDLMKLAGNSLKIWDATMADLLEIDIGSRFAPEFHAERVPRLVQVLEECKGKIGVNIELKYYGHDQQLEQRVADIVDGLGMADQIMVMSLKVEGVKKMKSLRPNWKVGVLMSVSAGNIHKMDADFLAVNAKFATKSLIQSAHRSGKQVFVWTVNDTTTMTSMISRGVDGLLTDRPVLARTVLNDLSEMTGTERMLLDLAVMLGAKTQVDEQ